MMQCVVIVPVYADQLSRSERASFRQTLSVLHNHDIVIVTHSACNLEEYQKIAETTGKDFAVELFDPSYFSSVESYNDLCYSSEFYLRFQTYTYMLICQLDVWIFSDQLVYWCNKGYDYIGAPIYHAYTPKRFTTKFLGIGNGGFSLRKIAHCLSMTTAPKHLPFVHPCELIRFYWNLGRYTDAFTRHPLKRILIIPTVLGKIFGLHNTLHFYTSRHINEDLIFGSWSNHSWGHHAIIPDEAEASRFSFEVNPSMLYQRNHNNLPFGCHAFMKWEYDSFWSQFINL